MPRKRILDALEESKNDDTFRKIPVVIFSTSNAKKGVEKAYESGDGCFVSKPDDLEELCDIIKKIGKFWVECVRVPG